MKTLLKNKTCIYKNDYYTIFPETWLESGVSFEFQVKSKNDRDVYTSYYPHMYKVLLKEIPDVLRTECFNENNLSFKQEVLNTELGHLFEHILIQKMSDIKMEKGEYTTFDGRTSWDWKANSYGTYNIWLNLVVGDRIDFNKALFETIEIFNKVIFRK